MRRVDTEVEGSGEGEGAAWSYELGRMDRGKRKVMPNSYRGSTGADGMEMRLLLLIRPIQNVPLSWGHVDAGGM